MTENGSNVEIKFHTRRSYAYKLVLKECQREKLNIKREFENAPEF
jgi:hypothetical protein